MNDSKMWKILLKGGMWICGCVWVFKWLRMSVCLHIWLFLCFSVCVHECVTWINKVEMLAHSLRLAPPQNVNLFIAHSASATNLCNHKKLKLSLCLCMNVHCLKMSYLCFVHTSQYLIFTAHLHYDQRKWFFSSGCNSVYHICEADNKRPPSKT